MSKHKYLAFDLGASSGRGIVGTLEDGKISLKEVNRFYNGMTEVLGSHYWDMFRLFDEIKKGIVATVKEGDKVESIGIDTWGVDYALLGEDGSVLGIPHAYRDKRTDTAMEELFKLMPKEKVYELTGIQFMQFNTLFQLFAAKRDKQPILNVATDLLFVADLINYFLCGVKKNEFTFASTSQLLNPHTGEWNKELFDLIGVPISIMQDIVQPGEIIGELTKDICTETGMDPVKIAAVASHDTGAAIAAIPASDENFAYISSGTWSLMGIESKTPIVSPESLAANLTNEGGVENTFRVLKNIMGLWLIQESRKTWQKRGEDYSFAELVTMSEEATAFNSLFDPDDSTLMNPADMPKAIQDICRKNGQPVPEKPGEFARSIYDSLALKYRYVLDNIKKVSDKKIEKLHIIGGGSQNELLCQFTANACGLPVIAGPAEGTALGNIMTQALALGHVKSLQEIRTVIKNSFEFKEFQPQNTSQWEEAYSKFLKIIN